MGAPPLLDEAISILQAAARGRGLALAYILKSHTQRNVRDRAEERLAWAERGLSLARELDDKGLLVRAMGYRPRARLEMGDKEGGLEEEREALALALSLGLGDETARLYINAAKDFLNRDLSAAVELFREGIDFAERRGLVQDAFWMKSRLAWCLLWQGQWDESLALAEEVAASAGVIWTLLETLKATVLLYRGNLDSAASLMEEVIPQARRVPPGMGLSPGMGRVTPLGLWALIEWRRGHQRESRAIIKEIERGGAPESPWFLLDVLWVLLPMNDAPHIRRLVDGTIALGPASERHALVTARAILAEAEGRFEEGAVLYTEAAKRWEEFGFISNQAQALLGAGRCLVGEGRPDEAKRRLEGARRIFAPLGARLFLDEIDHVLNRSAPSL